MHTLIAALLFVGGGSQVWAFTERAERDAKASNAAFECAAFAAFAVLRWPEEGRLPQATREELEAEGDRLFRYGYVEGKSFASEFKNMPELSEGLGVYGYAATLSDDFWVGFFWATHLSKIGEFLEAKTPNELGDSDDKARRLAAYSEFNRRNCSLIGR